MLSTRFGDTSQGPASFLDPSNIQSTRKQHVVPNKTPAKAGLQAGSQPFRSVLKENSTRNGGAGNASSVTKQRVLQYPNAPGIQVENYDQDNEPSPLKRVGTVSRTNATPLLDLAHRTPFLRRQQFVTPGTTKNKYKVFLDAPAPTPALSLEPTLEPVPQSIVRPSSTRKSLRRPSTGHSKFETPNPEGRLKPWDMSLSADGSMSIEEESVEAVEEEDWEVEYMPPTAIIPEFEPFDDFPDGKELGRKLIACCRYPNLVDPGEFDRDWDADFDELVKEGAEAEAKMLRGFGLDGPDALEDLIKGHKPSPLPSTTAPIKSTSLAPRAPSTTATTSGKVDMKRTVPAVKTPSTVSGKQPLRSIPAQPSKLRTVTLPPNNPARKAPSAMPAPRPLTSQSTTRTQTPAQPSSRVQSLMSTSSRAPSSASNKTLSTARNPPSSLVSRPQSRALPNPTKQPAPVARRVVQLASTRTPSQVRAPLRPSSINKPSVAKAKKPEPGELDNYDDILPGLLLDESFGLEEVPFDLDISM